MTQQETYAPVLGCEQYIQDDLPPILAAQQAITESPSRAEQPTPSEAFDRLNFIFDEIIDAATASHLLRVSADLQTRLDSSEESRDNREFFSETERSELAALQIKELFKKDKPAHLRVLKEESLRIDSATVEELRRRHFLAAVIAQGSGSESVADHHKKAFQTIEAPSSEAPSRIMTEEETIAWLNEDLYRLYFETDDQGVKDTVLFTAINHHENYPIADPVVERTAAGLLQDQRLATDVYLKLIERGDVESLTPLEDYIESRTEALLSASSEEPKDPETFNHACALIGLATEAIDTAHDADIPPLAARATKSYNDLRELLDQILQGGDFSFLESYEFSSIVEEDEVRLD